MKVYISVSFSRRKSLDREITTIVDTLKEHGISSFVFVDNYQFDLPGERKMMKQAMADIDSCDILIAETSDKAIGIGIEAGYAKAKNKTIIYLRQKDKEHSTTVSGISDFQVVYHDTEDLKNQLAETISKLKVTNRFKHHSGTL